MGNTPSALFYDVLDSESKYKYEKTLINLCNNNTKIKFTKVMIANTNKIGYTFIPSTDTYVLFKSITSIIEFIEKIINRPFVICDSEHRDPNGIITRCKSIYFVYGMQKKHND